MISVTNPNTAAEAVHARAPSDFLAATLPQGTGLGQVAEALPAAVQVGNASKYWIELLAYPPGSARSLWLFVNNGWRRLDNPAASLSEAVQDAFLGGSTVRVWHDAQIIRGLVILN